MRVTGDRYLNMPRVITLILLIFILPSEAVSGEIINRGDLLSLPRCVEIALTKHPDIVAAMNTVDIHQSRIGQARSSYYPQVNISSGYSRYSPASGDTHSSFDEYSGSAALKQKIYDFGRTATEVGVQRLNLTSSCFDLEDVKEQVTFNVKQAYYGVLKAKRNRDVASHVVKQFEEHLVQARGLYEVGTKPKFDVTKAQVDLSNAKLNLIRAENSLKIAMVTLNNAIGIPDAPEYGIEDNLSCQEWTMDFVQVREKAYENRADLKSLLAKKQAAETSISLARKDYFPTLSGNASYSRVGESLPLNEGWEAGLTVTFPLFSGFLTKYQVQEARSNLDVIRANEESLRQNILLEVKQAYLNLEEARERIPTAELAVRQAEENLELANGRYKADVGNPIEVTDALVAYSNAKLSYVQALYDCRVAGASLQRAMGTEK